MNYNSSRCLQRYNLKLLFLAVILIISIFIHFRTLEYACDIQAENEFMKTPDGKYIPKYNASISFKRFSELSKTCNYVGNKIECPDVRHLGETVFRQSQLAMNRILKIFDVICKKHSIPYWLSYGTLLGAVRHKGSIPWDHDADLCMIDKDYEKFVNIASKEFPEDILFQDKTTDPEFAKYLFAEAKLRDLNSCYGNNIRNNLHFHDGVQVDIFIFRREIRKNEDYLIMARGPEKYPYSNVFPLRTTTYDGFKLSCPNKIVQHLNFIYGRDFMVYPREFQQCPMYGKGYIPIPWHSCEYISDLHRDKQLKLLNAFSIVKSDSKTTSIFYRFIYKYIL